MRIELSGTAELINPLVIKFLSNQNFIPKTYMDMGYTNFDVICIGAGGGRGGGLDTANTGTLLRSYGGEGGGGGYHRVRGLLSALPTTCPVVVGAAGVPGTDSSNPASTTDGSDGNPSSFNATTCRASGGKGGKRVQTNSPTTTTGANGGNGGVGNSTIAGGGALGGEAGTPSATGPGLLGTAGFDGTYSGDVGQGGGGGAGGVGKYDGTQLNPATSGGRGAWNPNDQLVYGSGTDPIAGPNTGAPNIVPGKAGGAKAAPLNGLPYIYGLSDAPGTVIIRLTAD
jgi:hypothetical protein